MPNLTVYMPAEAIPAQAQLAQLTQQCIQLCTGILGAALERVHMVFVPCQHGVGHPIFAQVQYRLESFRTAQVMDDFMQQLDAAILQHTGCTARIRCFAYAAAAIHARN